MSTLTIKTSLFGIGPMFLYLAEIKDEERLVVLYQDPFFSDKQFKDYIRSRRTALHEKNEFSPLSDVKGGIYNNYIYLDFPSDFSKTKFRTLDKLFQVLPKDSLKKNIIKNIILFCEQMHENGDIVGNLAPQLFFIDNDGTPFNYGLYIGYDNFEINKKLISMKSEINDFLSPEHFSEKPISIKSDIFSLALSIISLYSKGNFTKDQIINNSIDIPNELSDYEQVLKLMLSPDPENRPDIKTIYKAFTSDMLPVKFAYYDGTKIADAICAKCQRPILLGDAQKIGNDFFCNECIDKISNKPEIIEGAKEDAHYCKYHAKRRGIYQCEECEAYLCDDCVEEVEGHYFCPEHAIEKRKENEREKSQILRAKIKQKREEQKKHKEEKKIQEDFTGEDSNSDFYSEDSSNVTSNTKQGTNISHGTDFMEDDYNPTVSEKVGNIDRKGLEEKEKEKRKKKIPLYIIFGVIAIIIITLLIINFGKMGTDSKEIKKYKKLFTKSVNFDDKILYGSKVVNLYETRIKKDDPKDQNYANAQEFLANFLLTTRNNTEKLRIFDKVLDLEITHKKIKDALKTFSEMKKIFKGDNFSYPQTLLKEGRFYKQIGDKRKAIKIFKDIQQKYPKTPFAKKAYMERKKI
ncbi:hypothetical protein J7L48_08100 [bacterium]|nr:hypothetical protein [bacterium]